MDLSNVNLLQLQSLYMQQDPTTKGLCAAFNAQLLRVSNEVKSCLIYAGVDALNNALLDELAYSMHVDWYDPKASIDTKRTLIKKSIRVHRYRGTPYALEEVIKDYFQDAEIKEWFEYGGDPYTFRVAIRSGVVNSELLERFTMAVNAVKNVRSHMDLVIIFNTHGDLAQFTHTQLSSYTYAELRERSDIIA